MRKRGKPKIATIEEIKQLDKKIKKPIDFEKLIKDCILAKKGNWYRVFDIKRLPEHVSLKISEMKQDHKFNPDGTIKEIKTFVKFFK